MIGVPASGKSSLARFLCRSESCRCESHSTELPHTIARRSIVSTDAIRAQLFGDESIQGDWVLIWQEVDRQFHQALARIQQGELQAVIYDATNARKSDRLALMTHVRHMGFTQINGIWLDTPLELCLERNRSRSRQVPEFVIDRMHRCLSIAPPHLNEGFQRLIRYSFFSRHDLCHLKN